jgi:hypothetical protein
VRLQGLGKLNNPMTSSGIESGIVNFKMDTDADALAQLGVAVSCVSVSVPQREKSEVLQRAIFSSPCIFSRYFPLGPSG